MKACDFPSIYGAGWLGIDPSLTGTALWFYNNDHVKLQLEEDLRGVARLEALRALLYEALENCENIHAVAIEGYSYASKGASYQIAEWGGVLRLGLLDCLVNLKYIAIVPPATLKKFVIGHARRGESGKEVMLLKTYKRWGLEFSDNDLCDAHGLAHAAQVIFRGTGTDKDKKTLESAEIVVV